MLFFVVSRWATVTAKAFARGCGRMNDYAFQIVADYRAVLVSSLVSCRAAPLRPSIYSATGLALVMLYKTNPSYDSFVTQLRAAACDLSQVPESVRNRRHEEHVNTLSGDERVHKLRRLSLLFFSILWRDNYPSELQKFSANCKYLKVGWTDLIRDRDSRLVDFGVGGIWLMLQRNMQDYDINELEWQEREPRNIEYSSENKTGIDMI
ncbi:uncharacterized protein LOC134839461 [Symsagittifera roscoffensis]|uniref:uncharacterized protein LOC134839461 n=1 Tax=Symsagittifera roscoffensis TaxID=84072 RepID=UPI00307BD310